MKRVGAIATIIVMCVLVIIFGNLIFIRSNSVLKYGRISSLNASDKNAELFIDLSGMKMDVICNGKVIKTYPISCGKSETPYLVGNWVIASKDTWGDEKGSRWIGFNVPWGKYGIHGSKEPEVIGKSDSHGCIRMYNDDIEELYRVIGYGIPVKVYGGPLGAFGGGFRMLEPGDKGADVLAIQKRLAKLGYFNDYANGIYGEETEKAVYVFRQKNNMELSNYIDESFYNKLGIVLDE